MNTFLRKLKLSFLAMLCGWIACNIAWWTPEVWHDERVYPVALYEIGIEGFISAMVILGAWLMIFLPVDLSVHSTSKLRRPVPAILCGFFAPLTLMALMFVCNQQDRIAALGLFKAVHMALDMEGQRVVLATCATGTVAAWTRVLMDKPSQNQTS